MHSGARSVWSCYVLAFKVAPPFTHTGKGVVVARSEEEALAAVDDMLVNKVFGAAGGWEHACRAVRPVRHRVDLRSLLQVTSSSLRSFWTARRCLSLRW